ncbi:hypothetical protein D3C85_1733430 [compost metagenome]
MKGCSEFLPADVKDTQTLKELLPIAVSYPQQLAHEVTPCRSIRMHNQPRLNEVIKVDKRLFPRVLTAEPGQCLADRLR